MQLESHLIATGPAPSVRFHSLTMEMLDYFTKPYISRYPVKSEGNKKLTEEHLLSMTIKGYMFIPAA
jgi:hypothetical protein